MIRLEPISLAHAEAVQALASDPLIAATSNVPHPYPADGAATWIRYTLAQRELGYELNFAILRDTDLRDTDLRDTDLRDTDLRDTDLRDTDLRDADLRDTELVGVCGVLNIAGRPRRAELGYWIGVPYWNQGYASAAARGLVCRVFEKHGIEQLYSSCLVKNAASFRVLEKTGFRHVGYGTHPNSKWGPDDRFALFELTKQEWLQQHD